MYAAVGARCGYAFNAASRASAAEWARHWTARACPLFCGFQFYQQVDWQYWDAQATPPFTPRPFAHDCAGPGNTDCANFISQALFYGGLPLTEDWFCYYTGTANGLCNNGKRVINGTVYPSKWSWAPRDFGNHLNGGLPAYLGDAHYLGSQPGSADTIVVTVSGDLNAQTRDPEDPYIFTLGEPVPSAMPADIQNLMTSLNGLGLTYGDVMYTEKEFPAPIFHHIFLIVGWGPYVETWEQLSQVNLEQLTPNRQNNMQVLYVADHGTQQEFIFQNPTAAFAASIAKAKPYYAVKWPVISGDQSYFIGSTQRHFIHIANTVTIPLSEVKQPETETLRLQTLMPVICPAIESVP